MPQQQPPQQTPAPAPAAPDPFSSMGGTAWGSVGGKPPPQSIPSYGDSTVAGLTQAPAVDNNPFGGQQQPPAPVAADVNNPFAATAADQATAPAAAPMNPFDMF